MKNSFLMILSVCLFAVSSRADTVTITSNHDTTIYKGFVNNSNGGGVGTFSGDDTNARVSRGLISFDVAGNVPAGATIQSVQLTLNLGAVAGAGASGSGAGGDPTPRTIGLYMLTASWGEGTAGNSLTVIPGSGAGFAAGNGDATWNARAYSATTPTPWTTAGGDYVATASGGTLVGNPASVPAPFTWTSTGAMVADVQSWLSNPTGNFGWILINSDEVSAKTSRAFYTHEATNPLIRPALQISYVVPEPGTLTTFVIGTLGFVVVSRRMRRLSDCRSSA